MSFVPRKRAIDLAIGPHRRFPTRHHVSVLKGTGSKDYHFPDNLAERALDRKAAHEPLSTNKAQRMRRRRRKAATADIHAAKSIAESLGILFETGKNHIFSLVSEKAASTPATDETASDYQALINGATLIQQLMIQRQFDGALEGFFGNMDSVADQGLEKLPEKYKPSLTDHKRQLGLLRKQVLDAFPKVIKGLAERNPGVPVHVLMEHAVELMAQELRQLLNVLALYTTTIQQYLSGKFSKMLHGINAYMESCFRISPDLPLSTFKVGDVVLSGFAGGSLGTIPAGRGALNLHLLLVQLDMQDWTAPAVPLLGHEWEHQAFHDIPGLETEATQNLAEDIRAVVNSGEVKLSSAKTKLGRNSVPTLDLIVKCITDCIGEIDADCTGGVLLHGPAFLYTMMYSFPAMLIRGGALKDAKRLLRTSSVYSLHDAGDGKSSLEFEPHPPDWIRVHIVAAALDNIGFGEDAARLRKLADRIVGEHPEFLTYSDADEKSDTVIKISPADIQALAPTIVKSLIRRPLKCLNGKARGDLVMWDRKRQAKVDRLIEIVRKGGDIVIPTDIGTILPTYWGSVAAKLYWLASHEPDLASTLAKLQDTIFEKIIESRNAMDQAAA